MRLLLLVALHAADMSNPTKPIAISIEWAARAMDEFFAQGDREVRRIRLPARSLRPAASRLDRRASPSPEAGLPKPHAGRPGTRCSLPFVTPRPRSTATANPYSRCPPQNHQTGPAPTAPQNRRAQSGP